MATKKKKVASRKPTVRRKRKPQKSISSPIKHKKMARKRRTTKKTPTRRRRRSSISGVGHGTMGNLLPIVAGAIAGRLIASKLGSKLNPKILAGAQLAAGVFLPKMVKNNKMIAGISTGLAVSGGISLLQSFGVIQGIAGMVGADDDSLQMEQISGNDPLGILAGDDDEMGLYDQGIMSGNLSEIAGDGQDWDEQINGVDDDEIGGADDYE